MQSRRVPRCPAPAQGSRRCGAGLGLQYHASRASDSPEGAPASEAHPIGVRFASATKTRPGEHCMRLAQLLVAGSALALAAPWAGSAHAGPTFDAVKQKGFVQCGVNTAACRGSPRSTTRANGPGIDIDLCRAVAAALFGDATKVKYTPLTSQGAVHRAAVRARSTSCRATRPGPLARQRPRPQLHRRQLL